MRVKYLAMCIAVTLTHIPAFADKNYMLKVINHTQTTLNVINVVVPESGGPQKEVTRVPKSETTDVVFTLGNEVNNENLMITSINNLYSECIAENFKMPLMPLSILSGSTEAILTLEIFADGPVACRVEKRS